jgi:hypothetical protein
MALDTFRLKTAFKAAAEYTKKNYKAAIGPTGMATAIGITGFTLSGFTMGTPLLCLFCAVAATGAIGVPAAIEGYKTYKATAPAPATPTA